MVNSNRTTTACPRSLDPLYIESYNIEISYLIKYYYVLVKCCCCLKQSLGFFLLDTYFIVVHLSIYEIYILKHIKLSFFLFQQYLLRSKSYEQSNNDQEIIIQTCQGHHNAQGSYTTWFQGSYTTWLQGSYTTGLQLTNKEREIDKLTIRNKVKKTVSFLTLCT